MRWGYGQCDDTGGLSRPVVGAQAGGCNTGTAGVAMTGDFRYVHAPQAVQEATAQDTAWKLSPHRASIRVAASADYDGNGTIDAATWSPATRQFTIDGRPAIRSGAAGIPVAAQYDGDGRAGPTVLCDGRYGICGAGGHDAGAASDIPMPLS